MIVPTLALWALYGCLHLAWIALLNRYQPKRAVLYFEQAVVGLTLELAAVQAAVRFPLLAAGWLIALSLVYHSNILHSRFFSKPIDWIQLRRFLLSSEMRQMNTDIVFKSGLRLVRPADVLLWIGTLAAAVMTCSLELTSIEPLYVWLLLDAFLICWAIALFRKLDGLRSGYGDPLRFGLLTMYALQWRSGATNAASSANPYEAPAQPMQHTHEAAENERSDPCYGICKGKNIIMIQLESFQGFLIGHKAEEQEVTPFLNKLAKQQVHIGDFFTYYGMGHTADAEFTALQSLLPLPHDVVNYKYAANTFHGLPHVLKAHGYTTAAYHGFRSDYYNRSLMMKAHGFDMFHGGEQYYAVEKLALGLSDEAFFAQTIAKLADLPEPFFSFIISLTSHFPFELPSKHKKLKLSAKTPKLLRSYFQSVHYTDQALQAFVHQLGEKGLLERSVLVLYGDHEGISPETMAQYNELLDPAKDAAKRAYFAHTEGRKVPFILASGQELIEGLKPLTQQTGGLLDVAPTLLHLLGIARPKHMLGRSLLSEQDVPVPLGNMPKGSYAARKLFYLGAPNGNYEDGLLYDRMTGQLLNWHTAGEDALRFYEESKRLVNYSEYLIEHDLLKDASAERDAVQSAEPSPSFILPEPWQTMIEHIPHDAVILPFPLSVEEAYMEANGNNLEALEELQQTYSDASGRQLVFLRLLDWTQADKSLFFSETKLFPHFHEHGFRIEPFAGRTLAAYLSELPDGSLIVLAGQDDCSQAFDEEAAAQYTRYGIRSLNREEHLHSSYINVLYKNGGFLSIYERTSAKALKLSCAQGETLNGIIMPVDLEIESAGYHCGNFSGILIDHRSNSLNQRGLNLAVLDALTGESIDKTYIDSFMTLYMDGTIYKAHKASLEEGRVW